MHSKHLCIYARRNKFLFVPFNQKYTRTNSILFFSSFSLTLALSPSLSLSLSLIFQSKLTNFSSFSFFLPLFYHRILHNLSYWFRSRFVSFVSFLCTGCTTLTITESKGLWQARAAAAADERTSRDSRAFSLGYHPVPKPQDLLDRGRQADGRVAGNRRRRCIRSSTGERGNEWG